MKMYAIVLVTLVAVCKHGSSWHVAGARVARAAYRAFSAERLDCWLAVHVGLGHVNVTLTGKICLQGTFNVARNSQKVTYFVVFSERSHVQL